MDINNLKHVVGKAEFNQPAVIRFFGAVDSYNCQCFNDEFLWLQDCVKPSKIVVLINSEGGSVVHGMSVFSVIQSCPIEVECVIEGVAASMASVIWSAGKNIMMHDYSLLMIHNPFLKSCDDNENQIVSAFRSQLETIYTKRFGLSKEQVKNIMDGEEGADGTFFTAKQAVAAGIIDKSCVIKTSKIIRDQVSNQIEGVTDALSLRDIMASATEGIKTDQLINQTLAILNKDNQNHNKQVMENETLNVLAVQLGLAADTAVATVSGRIAELLSAEKALNEAKAKFDELNIQFMGKEAEVANLNTELATVKASLKEYQDAEAAAKTARIEALIEDAVAAGKIGAEAKADWVAMASTNLDMVEKTLASIPGREVISAEIAQDKENQDAAKKATMSEIEAKIEAAYGDVELQKF